MGGTGDLVELSSGSARAAIARAGAEWRSWRAGGLDLLWTPDPRYWSQTAPVLFPVCGWTRNGEARVDGVTYPLGLHGFASGMEFELAARGEDFACFVLRDSAETRALYPFAFELEIEYRLTATRMIATARVRNTGGATMPYAIGLHPGFRWPFAGGTRDEYAILFDEIENPDVPVIAPGGLFSTRRRPAPLEGARLALSPDVFEREALCFLDARSPGLRFTGPRGPALRVEGEGYRHVVLWSRPGAPFLCVESWTGHGDPEGYAGELAEKPSMILLAPGDAGAHVATYTLESAG